MSFSNVTDRRDLNLSNQEKELTHAETFPQEGKEIATCSIGSSVNLQPDTEGLSYKLAICPSIQHRFWTLCDLLSFLLLLQLLVQRSWLL